MSFLSINDFQAQTSASDGFAKPNRFQVYIHTYNLFDKSAKIAQAQTNMGVSSGWDWLGNDYFAEDPEATSLELNAYCEKSELPSYQFQLETVRHYGPSFKIPHMPEYQDITMTFMCGSNMWERYFFDAWMYMIMDPVSNDFNYKNEYMTDIDIVQYYERASGIIGDPTSMNAEDADTLGQQFSGDYHHLSLAGAWTDNAAQAGRLSNELDLDFVLDTNYYSTLIDAFPVAINAQELAYDMNNTMQKVSVTFSYKFAIPFYGKTGTTGAGVRGRLDKFQQTIGAKPVSNPK
jgi:hypothetical protein